MIISLFLSGYLSLAEPKGGCDKCDRGFKAVKYIDRYIASEQYQGVKEILLDPKLRCTLEGDCSLLAQALVYEARGEGEKGRLAVGTVVLNRVKSSKYPNSIKEVLYQPYQFSYTMDMHKQKTPNKEDWEKAYREAYLLLNGEEAIPNLDGVLWYHSKSVKPKWSNKFERVAVIGNHYFYR